MTPKNPIHRLAVWPARPDAPLVASRQAVGAMLSRHPDQVKRWCTPIACDLQTRAPLYDPEEAAAVLRTKRRIADQDWRVKRRVSCA